MRAAAVILASLSVACGPPYQAARPLPAGERHQTGLMDGAGGEKLFWQAWQPAGDKRGVLVVMHGLKDHSSRYSGLAQKLTAAGYALYAFDLRGHGRSSGRRVQIDSFDQYVADLAGFLEMVRRREPGAPIFLFGHSMGGAIATLTAIERQPALAGLLLSGPALRLDVWPLTLPITRHSGSLTPSLPFFRLADDDFSSDPAVVAAIGKDPLVYHRGAPVGTAAGLIGATQRIWAGLDRLTLPILAMHGTKDKLTSPAGSRELVARAPSTDATLRLYEGFMHDLLHETDGARVAADIQAWLDAHTGGPAAPFAAAGRPPRTSAWHPPPGIRARACTSAPPPRRSRTAAISTARSRWPSARASSSAARPPTASVSTAPSADPTPVWSTRPSSSRSAAGSGSAIAASRASPPAPASAVSTTRSPSAGRSRSRSGSTSASARSAWPPGSRPPPCSTPRSARTAPTSTASTSCRPAWPSASAATSVTGVTRRPATAPSSPRPFAR